MNRVVAELTNLANGSEASGDRLAANICRDAIKEVERLQATVDRQAAQLLIARTGLAMSGQSRFVTKMDEVEAAEAAKEK